MGSVGKEDRGMDVKEQICLSMIFLEQKMGEDEHLDRYTIGFGYIPLFSETTIWKTVTK